MNFLPLKQAFAAWTHFGLQFINLFRQPKRKLNMIIPIYQIQYFTLQLIALLQQYNNCQFHNNYQMKSSGGKIHRENPSMKNSKTIETMKNSKNIEIIHQQFSPTFNNPNNIEIATPINNNIYGDLYDQNMKFTFKQIKLKAKSTVIDYLKNKIKGSSFTENTFNNLLEIEKTPNLHNFFQLFFNLIRDAIEIPSEPFREIIRQSMISPASASNKDLLFPLKSKQCKKIRLLKEQQLDKKKKKKSFKHLNIVEKTNEQMKTQLFAIRDQNNRLQGLIAGIVEEFKDRKSFYLAQIRKLTQIISVSARDVRSFIIQQTKQAHKLNQKQEKKGQQTSAPTIGFDHNSIPQHQRNFTGNYFKGSNNNFYQKQNSNFNNPRPGNISNRQMKDIPSIQQFDQYKNGIYLY